MWKDAVAIVVISLILGLVWPNYFKSKTSELEKQVAQDHEKIYKAEINKLQDQIKAITKEFTTCQNLLEDSNTHRQKHKDEVSKLQDHIKVTTEEFATCKNLLEDSNAHCQKHKDEVGKLQNQTKVTTKEFTTCQNLLEDCNAHSQKLQGEIKECQDHIKATTKEFTNCQTLLEDCNIHSQKLEIFKEEIDELEDQIKISAKEFATCQSLLGDCNARSHISYENSSDRLYKIILCGMVLMVFGLCVCGIGFACRSYEQPSPLPAQHSNYPAIRYNESQHSNNLHARGRNCVAM